jgi:hypothetical protein
MFLSASLRPDASTVGAESERRQVAAPPQTRRWVRRLAFSSESTHNTFFSTGRFVVFAAHESTEIGGMARRSDLSHARIVTAELEARRAAGETLNRIASLQDHVCPFGDES